MALTTTTLTGAMGANDNSCSISSATGVAAGYVWKCDDEMGYVAQTYVSGTVIPILRGKNGTAQVAHVTTANIVFGLASDFGNPNATVVTSYALAGRRRKVVSYSANGAIALPLAGEDVIAILNGTSALAMTVAAPTKDMDGALLLVASNGVAAHTIQFTGGLSGAGSNYDVITINSSAPAVFNCAMAINGLWNSVVSVPLAGTMTNITGTIG